MLRHYPRYLCTACGSEGFGWTEASGAATLHSWTVLHHAFDPAFAREVPYTVVIVDLAEGPRLMARLQQRETNDFLSHDLHIGKKMRVCISPDGVKLPFAARTRHVCTDIC